MTYKDAEIKVYQMFKSAGLAVFPQPHNSRFDLLVSHGGRRCRVDVKLAHWTKRVGAAGRYQVNIHKNEADIFVLLLEMRPGVEHFFCVPMSAVGKRKHLSITSRNPNLYNGYLTRFRNNWNALSVFFERGAA